MSPAPKPAPTAQHFDWAIFRDIPHAKRLVAKAGIEVWLKLFVNMRGSYSDDLERRGIAEKAINSWIGNTARMRHRHYHSVRPEDWAVVTGNPAPILRHHQRPSAAINPSPRPRKIARRGG